MSIYNKTTIHSSEKLLFVSKGIPSRTQIIFISLAAIFFLLSISGILYSTVLSNDNIFNTIIYIEICCIFLFISVFNFTLFFSGRRVFLKIYESHIEGYTGLGIFKKRKDITIDNIRGVSLRLRGLLPYIIIRTKSGEKLNFILEIYSLTEAHELLHNLIGSQFYARPL